MQKVLIVGGGFGGVKTALELADDSNFEVTLLSDHPYFRYYPTLHHTATGGNPAESNIPLSDIFGTKKINLAISVAEKIDREHKQIITKAGQNYPYDILILSLGMVTNYFGIDGLDKYSFSIKSVEEAKRFKNHLHKQLTEEHQPDLNYVVVGGGPTGIELAGELPHYLRRIMKAHGMGEKPIHVDLVEAAPQLVPRLPHEVGEKVAKHLEHLGVTVKLGSKVEGQTIDSLMVNGQPIESHTVVWTAGVTNNPFYKTNNFQIGEHGRVQVNEYMQAETDIYVIGDNAETLYTGMAQTALYDAKFVARNLKRQGRGDAPQAYVPKRPIYVLPAGPHWAAVVWGNWKYYGFIGWILRSLADLLAYKDYQPWWKAGRQWMKGLESHEDCPTCSPK